ncbi:MAG: radical SAM protein [Ignavibacteria bacterium]|nr:radical SAM protein [Ignavibacteria bacterium]
MKDFEPAYIKTYHEGLLRDKVDEANSQLRNCTLCPRNCEVDRINIKKSKNVGICRTGKHTVVCSSQPHFGEEAPLVGTRGSGTIFFTHCNLLCNFCQNFDISHEGCGREVLDAELASMMITLQEQGCHNINFITPSHVVPQILSAIELAVEYGLSIPLVYNSSGYDKVETLKLLEGVIDIYMPDFKFWDPTVASKTCKAQDYPDTARKAIIEMYRQVGELFINENGTAERGLLIRHLVLPKGLAGTKEIMKFIYNDISPNTYVNIMFQYRPCGDASEISELSQAPTRDDFESALQAASEEGITRLDKPELSFLRWF